MTNTATANPEVAAIRRASEDAENALQAAHEAFVDLETAIDPDAAIEAAEAVYDAAAKAAEAVHNIIGAAHKAGRIARRDRRVQTKAAAKAARAKAK